MLLSKIGIPSLTGDLDFSLFGNVLGSLTNHGRSYGREEQPGCMSCAEDEASEQCQGSSGKNTARASGSLHTWEDTRGHVCY